MMSHLLGPSQIFTSSVSSLTSHHTVIVLQLTFLMSAQTFRIKVTKDFPGFHQHTVAAIQSSMWRESCPAAADQHTMSTRM